MWERGGRDYSGRVWGRVKGCVGHVTSNTHGSFNVGDITVVYDHAR